VLRTYKVLKKDCVTGEYFYNGEWHSSYPYAEVEKDEDEQRRAEELNEDTRMR